MAAMEECAGSGPETDGYYERRATCEEYLHFHYPEEDPLRALLGDRAPPLEERYPFAVRRLWTPRPDGLALDAGCATGRVTLDLARDHRAVWGLDRSGVLVRAAERVRREGRARYRSVLEGRLLREHAVPVDTDGRPAFLLGDARTLPFAAGAFATVTALNLVDRVPDPARALSELARVVAPGGRLLVGSPYTWREEFTPFERWLGGFEMDRRPIWGRARVRELLESGFDLLEEVRLPFFIPHHARSGQLGVAHIQVFERKP